MLMALALVALPTGWTPALHAQEGEEADLTLDEALEIACNTTPGMRRAMNDLDLNTPSVRASWGSFLPTLSLNLGTSASFRRENFGVDNLGRPIENPQPEWVTTSSSSQSISSSVTLFDGGRRRNRAPGGAGQGPDPERRGGGGTHHPPGGEVERAFLGAVQQRGASGGGGGVAAEPDRELESTRRLFQVGRP